METPNMKTVMMTVAFLFDSDNRVLLIRKNRPAWQKGMLNGIGGHIEDTDKSIYEAAAREIEEESGLVIDTGCLLRVCSYRGTPSAGNPYVVYFFAARNIPIGDAETRTDEKLEIHDAKNLPKDTVYNLQWLIPLALDEDVRFPVMVAG